MAEAACHQFFICSAICHHTIGNCWCMPGSPSSNTKTVSKSSCASPHEQPTAAWPRSGHMQTAWLSHGGSTGRNGSLPLCNSDEVCLFTHAARSLVLRCTVDSHIHPKPTYPNQTIQVQEGRTLCIHPTHWQCVHLHTAARGSPTIAARCKCYRYQGCFHLFSVNSHKCPMPTRH